jgi:hypothetical protein
MLAIQHSKSATWKRLIIESVSLILFNLSFSLLYTRTCLKALKALFQESEGWGEDFPAFWLSKQQNNLTG